MRLLVKSIQNARNYKRKTLSPTEGKQQNKLLDPEDNDFLARNQLVKDTQGTIKDLVTAVPQYSSFDTVLILEVFFLKKSRLIFFLNRCSEISRVPDIKRFTKQMIGKKLATYCRNTGHILGKKGNLTSSFACYSTLRHLPLEELKTRMSLYKWSTLETKFPRIILVTPTLTS